MSEHTPHTTLVIGATGKTGRRVAERLRALGLGVRPGSRSGQPRFDWDDRSTWTAALDGVDAVYISFFPDLAVPGSAETVGALAERATAAGARRVVLLSGRGEEEAERAEQAVLAAHAGTTVVRANWFFQNFSEEFMRDLVVAGEVALPVDGVREAFVDADDIADVAVAALTEDGHAGRTYQVSGPRLLSFPEAVAEIGRATGRELSYVPVPIDAWTAVLAEQGIPDHHVALYRYLFTEVLDGRNASLVDGVQQALGRAPRDFTDYAHAAAAAGAWNA